MKARELNVLGPQVDFKAWEPILSAGPGPVTGWPAETAAIMQLREMPALVVIANGRNYHPQDFDPAVIINGR